MIKEKVDIIKSFFALWHEELALGIHSPPVVNDFLTMVVKLDMVVNGK
jgi:hypothetical protein